jgi:hypothetical protein
VQFAAPPSGNERQPQVQGEFFIFLERQVEQLGRLIWSRRVGLTLADAGFGCVLGDIAVDPLVEGG